MPKFVLPFLVALLTAAPAAAAQQHSAPPAARSHQRGSLATILKARIASITARVDMLRGRGAIGSEEAQELRKQARRLQARLYVLNRREAADVEFGIERLETRIGFVTDDARWGRNAFNGHVDDRESYERFGRYQADGHGDYEHFDRYTGSSVDRWHDPFDRGGN